jgi:outer membrane immunogenic protein
MKLFSGILGLTLSSVVALASANAADIYSGPTSVGGYKDSYIPAVWTGWYAGLNGGYGWSEYSNQFAFTGTNFGGISPEGGFGGGQIGYNWQGIWHPHLVVGIEADIQGGDIEGKAVDTAGNFFKSNVDYFGTVRGRVGYAVDRTLVYATGGFAYGGVKNEINTFSSDKTATGYVVGGGLEYKFSPAWSVKAEYQYINLGKNAPIDGGLPINVVDPRVTVTDDAFHTVRVGLNYHILPTFEPLK